jgi:hypothetical protein
MGTRSNIGIVNEDDSITAIYCHWDGFLSYNGKILLQHYTSADIVNQLMLLGDLSSLNEKLYPDDNKPHTFQNQQEDVCVAYGRERNESDVDCKIFKDIGDFEKFGRGVDYLSYGAMRCGEGAIFPGILPAADDILLQRNQGAFYGYAVP